MWRRALPVLALFFLSPLLAEYVSGSLASSMVTIIWLMAAMYGSGALLVRELAVRSAGGWPAIVLLGAAYAFIEEGWLTQSLFNPDYLGLRLLDSGYVQALGTGLPWLVYVIGIHVVWSICVPIGIAEGLFPARRREPWLKPWGIALFFLLFLAGSTLVRNFSLDATQFRASLAQQIAIGLVVVLLAIGAWLMSNTPKPIHEKAAPALPQLFALGFSLSAAFVGLEHFGEGVLHLPWELGTAFMIVLGIVSIGLVLRWRGRHWTARQSFAPIAGSALLYTVSGFMTSSNLHGSGDLIGHTIIVLIFLLLLGVAWIRTAGRE